VPSGRVCRFRTRTTVYAISGAADKPAPIPVKPELADFLSVNFIADGGNPLIIGLK
jgi:hypothetical protein